MDHQPGPRQPPAPIVVPPEGTVPVELKKVTLPEYVIEPPDVIRIEALIRSKENAKEDPTDPESKERKDSQGNPISQDVARSLPFQPVFGEYTVRPDGTVYLGVWGSVKVAGYTLSQAQEAIRDTLSRQVYAEEGGVKPENLVVVLDVTQYNSKYYYVFTDGGGAGMQVARFPITGSETVLDALTNIGGLSPVSSQRNIWVARRCPGPGGQDQILPVDWVGISQHGLTTTNYQIMPGDRVFVKAQKLVTIDTTLARIIQPIERLFGVVLLGGATVQTLKGNTFGGPFGI
jgi:polysaccharide export outer membrane protein